MTTTTYSKKNNMFPFYKKVVKQNISFSIIVAVAFILIVLLSNYFNTSFSLGIGRIKHGIYESIEHEMVFTVAISMLTVVISLVINAYMHSKQKVDFYHALPLTRGQIFTANMLAFLTVICLPIFVLTMGTSVVYYVFFNSYIIDSIFIVTFISTLKIMLHLLCTYLFISFIAVNVGTVFENVVLAGIIGFVPLTVIVIVLGLMTDLIFGFSANFENALWFSPYTAAFSNFYLPNGSFSNLALQTMLYLVVLCVAQYILGVVFYTRRQGEIAESKTGRSWPQIVSKVFISFVSALFFAYVFSDGNIDTDMRVIPVIIFTIIVGIVADIVLSRGIKNLVKNSVFIFIGLGLFFGTFVAISLDLVEHETYVPQISSIKSITVGGTPVLGRQVAYHNADYYSHYFFPVELTDPQAIETIVDVHGSIIEKFKKGDYIYYQNWDYNPIRIEYKLAGGRTVTRSYNNIDDISAEALQILESNDNYLEKQSPLFYLSSTNKSVREISYVNIVSGDNSRIDFGDMDTLLEALKTDMLEESFENMAKPNEVYGYVVIKYNNEIVSDLMQHKDAYTNYASYNNDPLYVEYSIPLTNEYTRTMEVLKNTGTAAPLAKPRKPIYADIYMPSYYGIGIKTNVPSGDMAFQSETISIEDTQMLDLIESKSYLQLYNSAQMKAESRLLLVKIVYDDGRDLFKYMDLNDLPQSLANDVLVASGSQQLEAMG